MTMVDRIKELSKEHNITVYELEDKLDFGRNTIYQWDKRKPSLERVTKVANYFNVSLDYLSGGNDNYGKIVDVDSSSKNDGSDVLLRVNLNDIPEDKKDQIVKDLQKYIKFLKEDES